MAGSTRSAVEPARAARAGRAGRARPDDRTSRGEEVGYGGPQVCKIVGISYRQLDYWARTDLLRPSLADAAGSGTQRRYSYRDLVAPEGDQEPARRRAVARRPRARRSSTSATTSARTSRRRASCSTAPSRCWCAPARTSSTSCARARACSTSSRSGRVVRAARREHPRARARRAAPSARLPRVGARASAGGEGSDQSGRAAPARAGALRAQLRAAVREAARLLRHRVGVRAPHVHAGDATAKAGRCRRSRPTSTSRPRTSTSRSRR